MMIECILNTTFKLKFVLDVIFMMLTFVLNTL